MPTKNKILLWRNKTMDYPSLFKQFAAEAFNFKRYRAMPLLFAILCAVGLIPFFIWGFALWIGAQVQIFFYNLLSSSTEYLEGWLKETKKGTGMAAEAVIYLVALPFIFLCRIAFSFFSIVFYLMWFFMQCAFFLITLGQTRWQPYLNKATFDGEKKSSDINFNLGVKIYAIGVAALFVLTGVFAAIGGENADIMQITPIVAAVYVVFAAVGANHAFKFRSESEDEDDEEDEDEDDIPEI